MYLTKHGENFQCTDAGLEGTDGVNRLAESRGIDEELYEEMQTRKEIRNEKEQYLYNPKHCTPFY